MSQDAVFLMQGSTMTVLEQRPYEKEEMLQQALADFPEVIAGPMTVGDNVASLLLIKRELGGPRGDGGAAAFSLDHLFIDTDAVPVLVEVKRSCDTRVRREVVGQMLDYVANAVAYWPVAELRQALDLSSMAMGGPTGEELVSDFTSGLDVEDFWRQVEVNLRSGRVRLIFVADVLPPELVRVIEFLNEQMSPAEVLGVELRQYLSKAVSSGPPQIVLVPRVVGRTSAAVATKVRASGGQLWSRASLLDYASSVTGAGEMELIRRLLDDAEQRGTTLRWGAGQSASVGGWESVAGRSTRVWMIQLGLGGAGDPPRLELELKKVALRLSEIDPGLERLKQAALKLMQIPYAVSKLQDARGAGWLRAKRFPLSELITDPAHPELVLEAVRLLADSDR